MKKFFLYLIAIFTLLSSNSAKNTSVVLDSNTQYYIKKVKKVKKWYIIYAMKNKVLYKIVSKDDNTFNKNCNKITIGKQYDLILKSHKESAPVINGVLIAPVGYSGCYHFDSETTICLEPNKDIYDLFYTNNLKGICYVK
ncbi:hypothetical protein [Hugenholtzia roseola]|uniref:hypothetical protein n=1 Tax=Hugenholtzia roseola TaxID=1002 RepID=UPI000478F81D|nr:hypothetical protein [Hugenholtzia roseola]